MGDPSSGVTLGVSAQTDDVELSWIAEGSHLGSRMVGMGLQGEKKMDTCSRTPPAGQSPQ